MPWRGPEYPGELPTLGFVVLDWIAEYLPSPAAATDPFVFTDDQAEIMLEWYTLDPESGVYVYRRGILEDAKGYGKSPIIAANAIAEFRGPVLFDGWDAQGEPVGRPWGTRGSPPPWIQIAAVSEAQTDNTYTAVYEMLAANNHRAAIELGIDDGRTRLLLKGEPGTLEPVTSSAGSREGQRVTHAVLDETFLWTPENGGHKLARTIRRNAAKMGGRTIETTNAPRVGDKSVAEQSGTHAAAGRPGILHHARRPKSEPKPDWSDDKLLAALRETYGDSSWVDVQRLLAEIRDPATPWDDARQFWFNIRVVGSGLAVDPRVWDALKSWREVPRGTYIGLGFDGSINQDATFLRGRTAYGYGFLIGAWVRPPGAPADWMVPRTDVQARVAWAFENFKVGRMVCDPPKWWTEVDEWTATYGKERVIALDTNQHTSHFSVACDRWLTDIRLSAAALAAHRGQIGPFLLPYCHDGDPLTSEHVKAAHTKKVRPSAAEDDGRTRLVIVKGEDRKRIDGAVAEVLAGEAAATMPELAPEKEPLVAWA